ncbi:hypothetical protein PAHAL_4G106200 [Panicum hallii]|uniref:Ent-kaurene oxidase n=1 Tax=Panicum hallii TaxID=206008 RepID=A0A2T8JCJ1_9POAL|nr:hypothetical protein PAHAL_4G106200 [Panicum hallii]
MESVLAVAAVGGLVAALAERASNKNRLNLPPAVPGLPVIGNLHQLKEKKPQQAFTKWAEDYGPIYSIKTGASSAFVLNSTEVAKEAMVEKFSSISTRKLAKAVSILSRDKKMVAGSDDSDFHKNGKRHIVMSLLGSSALKQFRGARDTTIDNMALSEDVSSIYVEEFGKVISRDEIYQATVLDFMWCVLEVDWRDFFPYLSWVPNKSFETRVLTTEARRTAVMRALVNQQKKRIARGEARMSYLDYLLAENKELTDEQLTMLIWEAILEAADTTMVATEWAMYELAKKPEKQDRLYQEIREVCGNETVTEEHLPRLPYLNAVFQETLRRHSPVPLLFPRFVHENTSLAGYDVPAGTEVIINVYACHMNEKDWDEPEEWEPERFLDGGSFSSEKTHKTIAFGAGRRVCAGIMQATSIACTSIARFVQEFAWKLKEGDEDKVDTVHVTAYKLDPLCAYLTPRGRN